MTSYRAAYKITNSDSNTLEATITVSPKLLGLTRSTIKAQRLMRYKKIALLRKISLRHYSYCRKGDMLKGMKTWLFFTLCQSAQKRLMIYSISRSKQKHWSLRNQFILNICVSLIRFHYPKHGMGFWYDERSHSTRWQRGASRVQRK